MLLEQLCQRLQKATVEEQKPTLDIKKHGGMMVLITELKRGINYGRSGNKETQGKVSRT